MTGSRRFVFPILGLLFGALPNSIDAATFYVSTSGNDARSCAQASDIATPRRTLNNAVACLQAGDTLFVRGGTYAESLENAVPSGTSWNSKVRIAAYPSETVWMTPSGTNRVLEFGGARTQQFIEFDGINFNGTGALYDVIKIYGLNSTQNAHHIRIQNGEVIGSSREQAQMIIIASSAAGLAIANEFRYLRVHGGTSTTDFAPHGFYINSEDNLIEYCEIYETGGNGIQLYNGNGGTASRNVVRYNRIHDLHSVQTGGRHRGVAVGGGADNKVYGNVIWNIRGSNDNTSGIQVAFATNTLVYNNTVFNSNFYGMRFDNQTSGTIAKNNIVYGSGVADIIDMGTTGLVLSNNLVGVDPKFVNVPASDFRLQLGSPAVNTGTMVPYVTTDLSGTSRPLDGQFDLGAYEYTNPSGSLRAPVRVGLSR